MTRPNFVKETIKSIINRYPNGINTNSLRDFTRFCRQAISKNAKVLEKEGDIRIIRKKSNIYIPINPELPKYEETLYNPFMRDNNFKSLMIAKYLCIKFCESKLKSKLDDRDFRLFLFYIRKIVLSFDNLNYFNLKFKDYHEDLKKQYSPERQLTLLREEEFNHMRDKEVRQLVKAYTPGAYAFMNTTDSKEYATRYMQMVDIMNKIISLFDEFTMYYHSNKPLEEIIPESQQRKDFGKIFRFYSVLEQNLKENLKIDISITEDIVLRPSTLLFIRQSIFNSITKEIFYDVGFHEQWDSISDLEFNISIQHTLGKKLKSYRLEKFQKIKEIINTSIGYESNAEEIINKNKNINLIYNSLIKRFISYYKEKEKEILKYESVLLEKNETLKLFVESIDPLREFNNFLTQNDVIGAILQIHIPERALKNPEEFFDENTGNLKIELFNKNEIKSIENHIDVCYNEAVKQYTGKMSFLYGKYIKKKETSEEEERRREIKLKKALEKAKDNKEIRYKIN